MRGDDKSLDMRPLIMTIQVYMVSTTSGKQGKLSVMQNSGNCQGILVKMSGICQEILLKIVIFMAKAQNFMK